MKVRVLLCLLLAATLHADPNEGGTAELQPFLEQHCLACHSSSTALGGLDLSTLTLDAEHASSLTRWVRVRDRVRAGEMPPPKAPQPSASETQEFVAKLDEKIAALDSSRRLTQGRTPARRLNRTEYERTMQDLLGIDVPLAEILPEDSRPGAFDTVSSTQQMSHFLLEKYLAAADAGLEAAYRRALQPPAAYSEKFNLDRLAKRNANAREPAKRVDDLVVWSTNLIFVGRMPPTTVAESGWYRIRLRAGAVNPPEGGLWATLRSGVCYSKAPLMYWISALQLHEEPRDFEFEAWIQEGHMLELRPEDRTIQRAGYANIRELGHQEVAATGLPGVTIQSLEMERIYRGDDPLTVRERLFGDARVSADGKVSSAAPRDDAKRLIRDFAARAFRRPVSDEEAAPYLAISLGALEQGADFGDALRAGYRAVLVSPRFLYLPEKPGPLDDYAVASRLSYFLWNSMPDRKLLDLAAAGRLREPAVLREQVERLLADPKAKAFTENFTGQWLDLRQIDFTLPDRVLYPEFDEIVKASMVEETHRFFDEMLANDLSVTNIVDSDFAVLNGRLAKHYGMEFSGDGFQRVSLPKGSRRGGILTQGSVLKVTANGTTTSPVVRGAWVTERILGRTVPPPPAGVPAVEPDIRGAKTIREQMEMHRNNATCSACHAKIDPPGFALESFDPTGAWRDKYRKLAGESGRRWEPGLPVDPSWHSGDGLDFDDVAEFKKAALADTPQIARGLAEKLLTYATGSQPTFADREQIDTIVAQLAEKDYGLRSMVHAVVESPIFLSK